MIPLGILASARVAGGGPPLIYRGSAFKFGNGSATKTYSAAPIGDPSATRTVIVAATSWSAGNRSITSVTIGGVSATLDANTGTRPGPCVIARAVVPTGTTADIVVTTSDPSPEMNVGVWTVDSLVEVVSTSVPSVFGSGVVTLPLPLSSTASGGFAVAAYTSRGYATTTTWTNADERYDNNLSQPSSGADAATMGGALTITATLAASSSSTSALAVAYDYA